MEAVLSLVLLGTIIIAVSFYSVEKPVKKTNELYITQKLHDVLKCSFVEGEHSLPQIEADFKRAFPEKSGVIELNNARIRIGEKGRESIAVSAVFYSEKLERNELRLLVYVN